MPKNKVSGEGRVSVLDKEGDCGGTCPFRYPVVTKKCIAGKMWEVAIV